MRKVFKHSDFPAPLQIVLASVAGLALRLFFTLRFPTDAGDTGIYEELARNWLNAHVYGLYFPNGLLPSDIRGPGYPAFIALLYLFFRRNQLVVLLAQAIVDLGTCLLIAGLASRLVRQPARHRTATVALWLAATCPLVANYAAVPLTEVLATFLTAAALLALAAGCLGVDSQNEGSSWRAWFAGGLLVGMGALVRPETPLVLGALGVVLAVRWRRPADWSKLLRVGALSVLGLLVPLAPWAARNWMVLHKVQFLAPRFAETPDEYTPRGLYAWTATWLVRFRDVYLVPWNVDGYPIQMSDIPSSAFDSAAERARTAALLDAYNDGLVMTPQIDRGFAELAMERTERHPLRTYLRVPMERAAIMWFTPRVELLPLSGHITPIEEEWRTDRLDFCVSLGFMMLNFLYVGLALAGVACAMGQRGRPGAPAVTALALLVAFILIRTAFLTTVETPEPRYTLECFPALLAVAAMAWLPRNSPDAKGEPRSSRGSR